MNVDGHRFVPAWTYMSPEDLSMRPLKYHESMIQFVNVLKVILEFQN